MQSSRPAPKSLLLVDDNHSYCDLVERAFRQAKVGTAVYTLSDGQRAIEHLAQCGARYPMPDLLLLDRVMPGGPDGYDVLRAARSLPRLAALPILMVSGSDEPEHVDQAIEAGASGYIIKPPVQSDYPQLVGQVLRWWREKSWSEVGPKLAGSCLAVAGGGVGSSSTMALTSAAAPLFSPVAQEQSLLEKVVEFIDWAKEAATASLDAFQVAFARSCRRHCITPSQAMRGGGSQRMVRNRRDVVVELINEKWPDETILDAICISATELKRLKGAARAKVGLKLDRANR